MTCKRADLRAPAALQKAETPVLLPNSSRLLIGRGTRREPVSTSSPVAPDFTASRPPASPALVDNDVRDSAERPARFAGA